MTATSSCKGVYHVIPAQNNDTPPDRLYKYRGLDKPHLERVEEVIIRNSLWCGSPLSFNDPFDCFPAIDTFGTRAEKIEFVKRVARRHGIGKTRAERRAFVKNTAYRGLRRGLGSATANDGGREAWRQTLAKMGVLSLTACCNDMLMWGHYAESHTGICFEFTTDADPFTRAHKVQYTPDRPIFRPMAGDRSDLMERALLRKADAWKYEAEWRIFSTDTVGKLDFPPRALTAIILGAAISHDDETALRALVASRPTPLNLMRSIIDPKQYRLNIVPA